MVVSAGSKRSRTVSAEAKYDEQSLQEVKIITLVYTLCNARTQNTPFCGKINLKIHKNPSPPGADKCRYGYKLRYGLSRLKVNGYMSFSAIVSMEPTFMFVTYCLLFCLSGQGNLPELVFFLKSMLFLGHFSPLRLDCCLEWWQK